MDQFQFILESIIWAFSILIFHELGHYLVAKHYGWKPKIGFEVRGFYVKVQPSIDKDTDIYKVTYRFFFVSAAGILGTLPAIVYSLLNNVDIDWLIFICILYPLTEFWLGNYLDFLKYCKIIEPLDEK